VDIQALPAPQEDAFAERGYEAPEGEIEMVMAEIWAEVLQVERVGRQDNFFELGGRSLLAVQMIARFRQAQGLEVAITDVFEKPVLASLAEWIIDQQLESFDSNDLAEILKHIEKP
jgi:aryl carrier-like protein